MSAVASLRFAPLLTLPLALFGASSGCSSNSGSGSIGEGGVLDVGASGGSGSTIASGGASSSGGVTQATGGTLASGGVTSTGGASNPEPPPWPDAPTSGAEVWTRVRNLCPFPLWIHAAGQGAVLQPDNTKLETGALVNFPTPATWSAARVTAYGDGPEQGELEKAEMTIGNGVLNYNVTYVDWVGLPLEIVGFGGNCDPETHTTGCYAKAAEINEGCPQDFLVENDRCLAPRSYCLNPVHQGEAYCKKLDSAISSCAECPKGSTPEVFACSGVYAEEPRLCAALNRGISGDPDITDASKFYQTPPYNDYAKWVHEVCPDIYAFSYDDWQSHGGFRACQSNELRITFCPNG